LIFHDRKGYENNWRKHHTSSVTRDIVQYDFDSNTFTKVISWNGEDRNPVWADDEIYFLSEKSVSFNVWKADASGGSQTQVTNFDTNPVRFLSIANNGKLCFGYDGEIYVKDKNGDAIKVNIQINADAQNNDYEIERITANATEFKVSPNDKEIAFIVHGEVFVTSIEYKTTKRITNTPEQERNLDFSPDGKKLIYSGERNGSWNIYQATLGREEDKYFYNATLIKEKALVATTAEEFQPQFSPDGEEIAYLEERTIVKIFNISTGKSRTVLSAAYNYSYADGDQYFTWSPDSKWLLVQFLENERWNTDIGLLDASGKSKPINLTNSGYGSGGAKFAMDGEMVYYYFDKDGFKSHGSWSSQGDVYALFLTMNAYNKFTMTKSEYELWKEEQKEDEKKETKDSDNNKKTKKSDDNEDNKKEVKILKIDFDGLEDRKKKLTIHSSFLADYLVDDDAEKLYYITRFEKDFDLWSTDFKKSETKILAKLKSSPSNIAFDKKQENIFFLNKGNLNKIKLSDGKKKVIGFSSEMNLNKAGERAYMFEHVWRQFKKKFYLENLHGVDWDNYKKIYAKFLPHINNGYDFAEMLSEMLGEINASHTGSGYFGSLIKNADQTAALGVFYDESHNGNGLKIIEVMDKSPLITKTNKIKTGVIIEKIDGTTIAADANYYPMLNRKAGKKVLLSFYNPTNNTRWDEAVKPISTREESNLAYERWIKTREKEVDRLSNGQIGYIHVRGMNSASFREVYDKVLGKHNKKKALIVDTRFNGGGWLHDDLATFLDGKRYMSFEPRGQKNLGGEPQGKWQKPSCVLMSESNYSDAHMFPYTYKALGIGKLIGMPVPGTGTAVWWETLIDNNTYFGIPQIGMRTEDGKLMENTQLEPDIKVDNTWNEVLKGRDEQLEAAVKHLLKN